MSSVVEFIPIPGLVKCRITAVGVDVNCTLMNIFNFHTDLPVDGGIVSGVADMVKSWVHNHYTGQVSEFVRFSNVEAWSGEEQFGPLVSLSMDEVGTAVSASTQIDYAWAPLIGLKTDTRGRFATGKWYAFAPALETMLNNHYASTHMDGLVSIAGQLLTAANDNATPWVVASETRIHCYPITGFKPSPRLTEQTRRRPDFGR
jgi:hypothetical protein